jgi:hypothetical protein
MLGKDKKQSDFKSRKEYLVALAIEYIEGHTEYIGGDKIYYDEAECDGLALAEDLRIEFDIDE